MNKEASSDTLNGGAGKATEKNPRQKGKPTPKRKDAEKRNERPLVVSKKVARQQRRAKRDAIYAKQQAALDGTGDPRYLPVTDQGPVRRYIRDYLDSRFLPGQLFMPAVLVFLIISWFFIKSTAAAQILMASMWGVFIYLFLEAAVATTVINRKLMAVTDRDKRVKKGNGRYVLMRAAMPKRLRRPKRAKNFGDYPDISQYEREIRQWMLG